jgi:hypothetical protein
MDARDVSAYNEYRKEAGQINGSAKRAARRRPDSRFAISYSIAVSSILAINDQTVIVEKSDGSLRLLYDRVEYAAGHAVPFHIFGMNSNPLRHATAGAFVITHMTIKFGGDRERWPVIARNFVAAKEAG